MMPRKTLPPTLSGLQRSQEPWELLRFCEMLREYSCRSYLEIGARDGDTLWTVFMLAGVSPCCAIDLPGAHWGRKESGAKLLFARDQIREHGGACNVVFEDSANPSTVAMVGAVGGFDAIFIDGDHRLAGVTADFQNYWPQAKKLIAFHDIAATAAPKHKDIDVPQLWRQIKQQFPGKTTELIAPNSGMGIGVLIRPYLRD